MPDAIDKAREGGGSHESYYYSGPGYGLVAVDLLAGICSYGREPEDRGFALSQKNASQKAGEA